MEKTFHLFDAYGTLLDVHAATRSVLDFSLSDVKAFSRIWREKQLEYSWVYSLMGVYKNFWNLTEEALEFALKAVPSIDASKREDLSKAFLTLATYDDVKPYLNKLKAKGGTTGILSNGCPVMLSAATQHSGLVSLLDQTISADRANSYKTNPVIYQMILDVFDCKKSDVCFYSANRWDVAGASQFGFSTVWVNRSDQPDEYEDQAFSKQVSSFDELAV